MEDTCSTKPISTLVLAPQKRKPISLKSRPSKKRSHDESLKIEKDDDDDDDDELMEGEDEKEEVERRIEALQRIVPGGESLGVDKLFEETADYIMALQSQLKAMTTLASLLQRLHYHNTNFPG